MTCERFDQPNSQNKVLTIDKIDHFLNFQGKIDSKKACIIDSK